MIASAIMGITVTGGGLAAAITSAAERPAANAAAASGTVLGGRTSQRWPVVVELSKDGSLVKSIMAGIHFTCTSGKTANVADDHGPLIVNNNGTFIIRSSEPVTIRNPDGTTTDFEGNISGKFNKARTKVSGKWQEKVTEHDAAGAVTDTCDTGSISWSAKA